MGEWLNYFKCASFSATLGVLKRSMKDLTILSSQKDLKEVFFPDFMVDINWLKGPRSGIGPRGRNRKNTIIFPIEVEKLMVANQNAMLALSIDMDFLQVFSFDDVFIDSLWLLLL